MSWTSSEEEMFELSLIGFLRVCRSYGEVEQRGMCRVLKICWECNMSGVQSTWLEGAIAKCPRADGPQHVWPHMLTGLEASTLER